MLSPASATAEPPGSIRRAHLTIAVVFALHGAVSGTFATRIPWIKDHLGLSAGALGLALVCPAIGSSLLMPLAGRLMHVLGSRGALRLLLGLWCAALALPAAMPGLPWLCAALLVFGACAGMADVVMNAVGVAVEERKGRSIMSGLHGMWSVGTLVGAAIGVPAAHVDVKPRRWTGRVPQFLALAATVASLAIGVWIGRSTLPGQATDGLAAANGNGTASALLQTAFVTDPKYLRERAALVRSLESRLAALPPETQNKVAVSLQTIRASMKDLEAALGKDPSNALLQELLVNTYQEEMRVLAVVNEAGASRQEI